MSGSKSTIKDFAVCGGTPTFTEKLYVNRPNVGSRDIFIENVDAALDRFWFTNDGPLLQDLEEKLASYLGVDHCVVVNNGTTAMALAIRALELEGEIILPSFSFISTAHTLLGQGIKPVFCDIDPDTWNIDPDHCQSLVTSKTTAIIGTHLWGRPCEVDRLDQFAQQANIPLIFDAAHAFGCTHNGNRIGRFGTAEVFSFHATKVFHTFEGGAVTTNDSDLAENLRMIRNFGFTGYDQVEAIGTNAKMPEVCAAMGLANLQSLNHFFDKNRDTYQRYEKALQDIPGLELIAFDPQEVHNNHYIVLNIEQKESKLTRDELLYILQAENVLARRYFYPGNHRMEPYCSRFPEVDKNLPVTNRIAQSVLLLPGGSGVSAAQINQICAILRIAIRDAGLLSAALRMPENLSTDPTEISAQSS